MDVVVVGLKNSFMSFGRKMLLSVLVRLIRIVLIKVFLIDLMLLMMIIMKVRIRIGLFIFIWMDWMVFIKVLVSLVRVVFNVNMIV